MSEEKKSSLKPIAVALGATFAVSVTAAGPAHAEGNPFGMVEYGGGYMVADAHKAEGKCGEGKCGEGKEAEGKCGEGKCGEGKEAKSKEAEGKCGEDKCGH